MAHPAQDASPELLVERVASHAAVSPATEAFVCAFASPAASAHNPGPPESLLPDWLAQENSAVLAPHQRDALLSRAPLWIRLQTDHVDRLRRELGERGIGHQPSAHLASAWRVDADAPLLDTEAFRRGDFEVQDIGSQSLLASLATRPTGHWLDACAGAGGKTLQLARMLGASGRVTAHDVRGPALRELEQRARRAGLVNVAVERHPQGRFDGVLVDAPCSGSGTWRRSPHLKWTTTPDSIRDAAEKQLFVLTQFADRVRAGGTLVYATCSLCRSENEAIAERFLRARQEFSPQVLTPPLASSAATRGQWTILPADLDSDAYFVAAFQRS